MAAKPEVFRIKQHEVKLQKAYDKAKAKKGAAGVIIPALKQYLLGEDENGVFVVKK